MSFSGTFEVVDGGPTVESINFSGVRFPPPDVADLTPAEEIFYVSVGAVKELLETGVIGSEDKKFKVTVSGHANEGHVPTEGWSNDFVNIQVHQL